MTGGSEEDHAEAQGNGLPLFTELPRRVLLGNLPRPGCPKQSEQRNRCYSSSGTSRTS